MSELMVARLENWEEQKMENRFGIFEMDDGPPIENWTVTAENAKQVHNMAIPAILSAFQIYQDSGVQYEYGVTVSEDTLATAWKEWEAPLEWRIAE